MVTIAGLGKIDDLTVPRQSRDIQRGGRVRDVEPRDAAEISEEAQDAAEAQRLLALSAAQAEVRQERVERARQDLESGTYRIQDVVAQVAGRISSLV